MAISRTATGAFVALSLAIALPLPPAWAEPAAPMVELHYAPAEDLERIDVALIGSARASIDMAAYFLTDPAVIDALLEAVKRGLARDPRALPRIERDKPLPNGANATVELLKVLLRMTAEQNAVAAKVIATTDDLERIAVDDEADVPAMKGWRRELFGERALALKAGRIALAVEKGRVISVER